jgi:hypothetical protein
MMSNVAIFQPFAALVAGLLILIMPRLLNIIIAIYLIVVGMTGLWPHMTFEHSFQTWN